MLWDIDRLSKLPEFCPPLEVKNGKAGQKRTLPAGQKTRNASEIWPEQETSLKGSERKTRTVYIYIYIERERDIYTHFFWWSEKALHFFLNKNITGYQISSTAGNLGFCVGISPGWATVGYLKLGWIIPWVGCQPLQGRPLQGRCKMELCKLPINGRKYIDG